MRSTSEGMGSGIFLVAVLTAALGSACSSPTSPASPPPPTPPALTPTPAPPIQHTATPVPFNLTQSRTFDVLGWDSVAPGAITPSTIQFRWNAAIGKYEMLAPWAAEWSRLEAQDTRGGGSPYEYDVFGSGETKLPIYLLLFAPPHRVPADGHVGNARIFEGLNLRAYFAFGIATAPADVPVSGTMTCGFAEDEIGEGALTFDLAAGTVSGWAEPFWGRGLRYQLQTSLAPRATTFAATFGTEGVLEGRFFGPGAVNVAVRAKGGGQFPAAVTGIMTGVCK